MDKKQINVLQHKLLQWYLKHGRLELPWRNLTGLNTQQRAYRVYLSEIMLQQTQVKSVLERYYFPFLEKFPNLLSIAQSKEENLLQSWSGLGYYSRARNIYKTALYCKNHYQSNLPNNLKELQQLNGIGHYTAGAIMCFGFNIPCAFFDSNIKRVLIRLFAIENPTFSNILSYAEMFLNQQESFNHNQALIDLGAMLCLPKSPKCLLCPLNHKCLGKHNIKQYSHHKTINYQSISYHLLILTCNNKIALLKSPKSLYKGLYVFPLLENAPKNTIILGNFKHSYTRYKLNISVELLPLENKEKLKDFEHLGKLQWHTIDNLCSKANVPLASITLKALEILLKNTHKQNLF